MKTLLLIGRSGSGKTTLASKLTGLASDNHKTPFAVRMDWVIDTPGGFTENRAMAGALSLYAYEADMVGLIIAADEAYSLYNPGITGMVNREVIGIVTKTDSPQGNADRAERWLRLAGCKKVFQISALTGEGIQELKAYIHSLAI